MADPNYPSHQPIAPNRNASTAFNYVWDSKNDYWTPQSQSQSSLIIGNAKSNIHKFGSHPSITKAALPNEIWDGASSYTFPSDSGQSLKIKSSDGSDSQNVVVIGLDDAFKEQIKTVTLTGTTAVSIAGTWTRVYRMYNDSASDFAGDISITDTTQATTYAKVLGSNNQTLMSIYTIPSDYTGYLLNYKCSGHNAASSTIISYTVQIRTREFGKAFRTREVFGVTTQTSVEYNFAFPMELPPKSDIVFTVTSANSNGGSVNADFDIALL